MSQILNTIDTELISLNDSASCSLAKLVESSDTFLRSLKQIESQLQADIDSQVNHGIQALGATPQTTISQESHEIVGTETGNPGNPRKHPLAPADEELVDIEMSKDRAGSLDSSRIHAAAPRIDEAPLTGQTHQLLEKASLSWYKSSIDGLKKYNAQVIKFHKNVVQKLSINLDDAYTFPLQLPSYPCKNQRGKTSEDPATRAQQSNQDQLLKSIILHLLKTGHGDIAEELLDEYSMRNQIEPSTLRDFKKLSIIVSDIESRHDLTNVLEWLESRSHNKDADYEKISFKFHMLQFALLLSSRSGKTGDQSIFDAYIYAKQKFPPFFQNFLDDMSPLISCILFTQGDLQTDPHLRELKQMSMRNYVASCEKSKRNTRETRFVTQLLDNLYNIHDAHFLFNTLAHDFVAKFCSDLSLSSESSLFQSVLSGFVNLPNFYRYSHLQKKLKRSNPTDGREYGPSTVSKKDLPFQIPDKNQFLFNYHPLFICPISKEQLMPLVTVSKMAELDAQLKLQNAVFVSKNKVLVPMANPVVVFEHCRHLALKESVRQLTKNGSEVFKCHYCYKKHKYLEVSEAYFIDL